MARRGTLRSDSRRRKGVIRATIADMPLRPARGNFAFPTRYRLGCGRRSELAAEARALGIRRALLVTDAGVAALPWFRELVAATEASGVPLTIFSSIGSNPTEAEVGAGIAAYREAGCDGVVMIGGGSAMDAGKVIALLSGHPDGTAADYQYGGPRARTIRGDAIPPMLAMPTTAGTGSEVSTGAVVTDRAARVKRTIIHPSLLPGCVIADPETTFALPPHLTAATGMDAFTHALEAYLAPGYHPMADAIALEALCMLRDRLATAVRSPDDAVARTDLLMAASMAAVAFQKGLGLVHAMAHPLGAVTDIHHGLANAVLLPYALELNRPAIAARCEDLADRLRLQRDGRSDGGYRALHRYIVALRAELGLPARLADVPAVAGGGRLDPADLAALAMGETLYLANNPRPVTAAEVAAVYAAAISGQAATATSASG
jgi:alcohol dehydrogenase class IV